jgi:hypothetical protein
MAGKLVAAPFALAAARAGGRVPNEKGELMAIEEAS